MYQRKERRASGLYGGERCASDLYRGGGQCADRRVWTPHRLLDERSGELRASRAECARLRAVCESDVLACARCGGITHKSLSPLSGSLDAGGAAGERPAAVAAMEAALQRARGERDAAQARAAVAEAARAGATDAWVHARAAAREAGGLAMRLRSRVHSAELQLKVRGGAGAAEHAPGLGRRLAALARLLRGRAGAETEGGDAAEGAGGGGVDARLQAVGAEVPLPPFPPVLTGHISSPPPY